jgi:hypothetical protein
MVKRVSDCSADEGADDPQNGREDQAHWLPTWHQEASDGAGDQTENYPAKNMHGYSSKGEKGETAVARRTARRPQ